MAMHCAAGATDTPKEAGSFTSATHGLEHADQGSPALQYKEGQVSATQGAMEGGWGDTVHQSFGTIDPLAPVVDLLATHHTSRAVSPTLLKPQGALQFDHSEAWLHKRQRASFSSRALAAATQPSVPNHRSMR